LIKTAAILFVWVFGSINLSLALESLIYVYNIAGCQAITSAAKGDGKLNQPEKANATYRVFGGHLVLIAHLIVLVLVLEVMRDVLVPYCLSDTKPNHPTVRWTFAACRKRNRFATIVALSVRPNSLVPDWLMKPAIKCVWEELDKKRHSMSFFIITQQQQQAAAKHFSFPFHS